MIQPQTGLIGSAAEAYNSMRWFFSSHDLCLEPPRVALRQVRNYLPSLLPDSYPTLARVRSGNPVPPGDGNDGV